jgi:hypothetical protein
VPKNIRDLGEQEIQNLPDSVRQKIAHFVSLGHNRNHLVVGGDFVYVDDELIMMDVMAESDDRQRISASWSARGFTCEVRSSLPGQCWKDLVHVMEGLVMVREGEMEFEIAGKVHHPEIEDELHIPAGAVNSARNIGTKEAIFLYGSKRA